MNASEYFPVNLKDYVLDYIITDEVVESEQRTLKANIIAAQSNLIESYYNLAEKLGLRLVGIDYSGNSLSNFLKREAASGTALILDLGSKSTMVSVVTDGIFKFNRNLLFGINQLIENIMDTYEITWEEALRHSISKPLFSVEEEEKNYESDGVSASLEQILTGVSRLIDYYSSRNPEKISRIYLVGGGAYTFGIEEYIGNYFNLPTQKIEIIKSGVYTGNGVFSEKSIYFANVIGATFSEINLLPKSLTQKISSGTRNRITILSFILVFVTLLAIYLFANSRNLLLEKKMKGLQEDITKAEEVYEIRNVYEELNKKLSLRKQIFDESKGASEDFAEILKDMETRMPSEVFYLSLADTGESIEISCIAADKITVAKFIQELKKMEFKEVVIPGLTEVITENDETYVSFSVSCKYGGEVE